MRELIESLADRLVEQGARYAFGITGSGPSLSLITHLEARGVCYINACHEASAVIMAGGATRAYGAPALSISIKGPGLANALGGIAFNHFENIPSISVSEAYGKDSDPSRMHKRLDQLALLKPLVKGVSSLEVCAKDVERLVALSREEVPGPVHIDLCAGDMEVCVEHGSGGLPEDEAFSEHLNRLLKAKRPVLIAGSLVCRKNWRDQIEMLRIPVFATAAARGVVDERSSYSAGVFTGDGKSVSPEHKLFSECDLVVGIGLRPSEITGLLPSSVPTLVFDVIEARCLPPCRGGDVKTAYVSDMAIASVFECLRDVIWGEEELLRAKAELQAAVPESDWLPSACYVELNRKMGRYSMVLDTGNFCTIAEHMWLVTKERLFFGTSNGRFMGGGVPSAIGISVADRTVPVYCVIGDGGLQAYPGELKTIVSEALPICIIFMSDGGYGSVACSALSGMSSRAINMPIPTWAPVAESVGMDAVRCDCFSHFESAISRWTGDRPLFVECRFDPVAYRSMVKNLR
jgi:acetolactate synthase-1/2/3 large subunit